MALDSYSNLKTAIANYLNRTDLTSYLDDFIDLTEARHARELRLRPMITITKTKTTSGNKKIQLPSDYLQFVYIQLNSGSKNFLQFMSPNELSRIYGGEGNANPAYYSIMGDSIILGPTPSDNFTLEMAYYQKPPALNSTTTTNEILKNYPDLYLYGCLLEAQPFIMADERLPVWAEMYKTAVRNAEDGDAGEKHSGSPLQMTTTGSFSKARSWPQTNVRA
jgi:hypothetical protein|tara:strand:- start:273 stop:935 length:663 start_codon:yes stop_codon:yes gene_type:complete